MRRFALTILITALLTGAGVLYAQFTRPMLRVTAMPPEAFEKLDPPAPSPEFADLATRYLAAHPWVVNAPYRHRDKNTFLYCQDYLLGNEKRSLSLTPFAVVMAESVFNGKEDAPITMVAEAAQIDFSGSLGDAEFDVGRVTSGQLLGRVRIEGPDGLLIKGRNLFVDESSRRIWSDDIVQFWFGTSRGQGRGLEIRLGSEDETDGLLASENIRTVRIREDVALELADDDLIYVQSRGHLEFDLETNVATLERNIQVRKPTGPNANDTLKCDMMTIHFERTENTEPGKGSSRLKPLQLTATGNVELQSMENELLVTQVSDLNYLLEENVIELANSLVFPNGTGPRMKIIQQSSDMLCRRLILVHDEDNQLRSIHCPGEGLLKSRSAENPDELALVAKWSDQLILEPSTQDGIQLLRITGKAIVQQPADKTELRAESIRLWLKERPASTSQLPSTQAFAKARLYPIQMEANRSVYIKSPQMSGPTNRLVVLFDEPAEQKPVARSSRGNTRGLGRGRFSPASYKGSQERKKTDLMDRTFKVRADTIRALVRPDATEGQSDMPEVHLKGRVQVQSVDSGENMLLKGDVLHVLEDQTGHQKIELIGSKSKLAMVEHDKRLIEGLSIYLDRASNRAEVIGTGSLKVVVDKTLEGKKLTEPEPLEIVWSKDMTFDGQVATLRGNVTARLGDDETQRQELICPTMRVHFTEPISFSEGLNGGNEAELGKLLNNIECLGGVTVNSFEFSQGRTAEERHAFFQSVDINQKTGNTRAVGPGWITSWTQDRPRLSRAVSARANASVEARKSNWNYTRIEFLGALDGNYHQRTSTFKRNVSVVYGPVERLSQVVDPDAGPDGELPEGAIRMACDSLEVTERGSTKGQRTMELLGSGNAKLDGRKVHAEADEIKYDEYKELFTLSSRGDRKAHIWRRERVGAPWRGVSGSRWVLSHRKGNQALQGSSITGGSSGM